MALKIIKCPWCEGEARITYEENRVYQMKCYSCHNTMLHVDHSFDSAVEFFEHHANLLQAENEGRMVIMPCKVGDTVWVVFSNGLRPYVVDRLYVMADSKVMVRMRHMLTETLRISGGDFGKTAFLTREEAEAALKVGGN